MLAAVPVVAIGDDGSAAVPSGEAPAVPQALLDVREEIAVDTAEAIAEAPLERSGSCAATLTVDGLGDTCRTPDGLLRVELEDGSSFTTHGVDAPPLEVSAPHLPASQTAVNGADQSDIACTPTSSKHITLVYARPSDRPSRYATIKPLLQQETYRMSAFLDAESQSVGGDHGKRMRLRCDGDGTPTVLNATLPALGAATGATFSEVVNGLKDLGYDHFNNSGALERYVVFYDAPSSSGAAGTGHLYEDSSAGAANLNNKAGMFAVEYRWTYGDGVPHWDVLLHEAGHNMGAISDAAPNASGAGHCNDGLDIMCYADGGATSTYGGGQCSTEQFDCRRNDYFNPVPPAGSYLATHWNAAATYNDFLEHRFLGDSTAPTTVTGLVQTGASDSAIAFSWNASTDDKAVTSYRVFLRTGASAPWVSHGSTIPGDMKFTITPLAPLITYQVGVQAYDAAGNGSTMAVLDAATNDIPDAIAPQAPSSPSIAPTLTSVRIAWGAATDDVGVSFYEVLREVPTSDPLVRDLRSAGTTSGTAHTVAGLKPDTTYTFRVIAYDNASNQSSALRISIRTLRDTTRPTTPTFPRITLRGMQGLKVNWGGSLDAIGVTKYHVYRLNGTTWMRVATVSGTARSAYVTGLSRRSSYRFRIRAADAAGNLSRWSGTALGQTR